MRDVIELIVLLFFLSLGYVAARDVKRPVYDTVAAFAWWLGMFAILIFLMLFPSLLVSGIRIGIGVAALYFVWYIAQWIYHTAAGLPMMQHIKGRHIRYALRRADRETIKALKDASREALRNYRKPIVLDGVASIVLTEKEDDDPAETLELACRRSSETAEGIISELRRITENSRRGDRRFIETLILCCGAEAVERAMKRLKKEDGRRGRTYLVHLARHEAHNKKRSAFLRAIGVEAPLPTKETNKDGAFIDAGSLAIAALCPLCVYLFQKKRRLALAYGLSYFVLLVYSTALFGMDDRRAWVFLAVLALIHLTAFLNAGIAWATKSGEG